MILDVHGQPLGLRIERRTFRHRPRQQHAVVLEPEVVVQVAGEMFLHAEEAARALLRVARPCRPARASCVKSRFCWYSSSAMADGSSTAQTRVIRLRSISRRDRAEQQHDPGGDRQRSATAPNSVGQRHRLVERRRPGRRGSCRPTRQEPDAHHQADDARRRELGHRAEADRAEAQLAERVNAGRRVSSQTTPTCAPVAADLRGGDQDDEAEADADQAERELGRARRLLRSRA